LHPPLEESNPELTQADHRANRKASVLKTIRTSVWTKFPSVIILLVVLPLATREFGPTFNAFAAILALLSTFQTFNLGVGPAAAMELSKFAESPNEEKECLTIGQSALAYVLSSVLTAVIFIGAYFIFGQNSMYGNSLQDQQAMLTLGTVLIAVGILLNGPSSLAQQLNTGYLQEHKNAQANIVIQSAVLIISIFAVTVLKSPAIYLFTVALTHPTVTVIHSLRFFLIDKPHIRPRLNKASLSNSVRLLLNNCLFSIGTMGTLTTRALPVLLIGFYSASSNNIGTASLFISWLNPILNILTLVTVSLTPAIATAITNHDFDWAKKILQKLAKYVTLTLAVGIPLAYFVGPIVHRALFPSQYSLTSLHFALLLLAATTSAILGLAFSTSAATKRYKQNAQAGIIQAVVGTSVAIVLLPNLGITGMALAIIMSETVALIYLAANIRISLNKPPVEGSHSHAD
jgi:O-antigen/teichoic acid export membrane protein